MGGIVTMFLKVLKMVIVMRPDLSITRCTSLVILNTTVYCTFSRITAGSLSGARDPVAVVFVVYLVRTPLKLLLFVRK